MKLAEDFQTIVRAAARPRAAKLVTAKLVTAKDLTSGRPTLFAQKGPREPQEKCGIISRLEMRLASALRMNWGRRRS